jgi:methyl-accepting chemotaxis protein
MVLKKIKDSIDKISKSTTVVLQQFETINTKVKTVSMQEENIRNAMEEQNTGSKQILDAITRLNDINQLVKSGSVEMLNKSQDIIKESNNLIGVTVELTNGVNEMAVGAEQINTSIVRVNATSGENKESINNLVREVDRFKVE